MEINEGTMIMPVSYTLLCFPQSHPPLNLNQPRRLRVICYRLAFGKNAGPMTPAPFMQIIRRPTLAALPSFRLFVLTALRPSERTDTVQE
jgi:hypothetical protein